MQRHDYITITYLESRNNFQDKTGKNHFNNFRNMATELSNDPIVVKYTKINEQFQYFYNEYFLITYVPFLYKMEYSTVIINYE